MSFCRIIITLILWYWDKILFEAKAVERLTEVHVKQVFNYLAISKLELGLLVNFGADSLEWKRVVMSRPKSVACRKIFGYEAKVFYANYAEFSLM